MTAPQERHDQPLRILMAACVPRKREGGVAAIIYGIGDELERRGHSVTYVFDEDLLNSGSYPARLKDVVFALRLSRLIVKDPGRFSIVNLHAPAGFVYGWQRRRAGLGAKLPPYVMTLHGLEERRVEVMNREQRKGRAWNFSLKNRLWHRFYIFPRFRWSIGNADGAHTYSRDVWNLLQLRYHLDPSRCFYIPNGVESRFATISREYTRSQPLKLLYVGTWLDQRGIFYIRDALARLAPKLPGLTMTFAGCAVPAQVIADFFGPQLAANIVVQPIVPAASTHELYAAHDIFLFPSLMEGLPSVVLEAMASGMPVITAETCGMPDIVEDEFNGLLIPPADSTAIEHAVLRLGNSPALRQSLGEQARRTMARYTWARSAIKFERLLGNVLGADGPAKS